MLLKRGISYRLLKRGLLDRNQLFLLGLFSINPWNEHVWLCCSLLDVVGETFGGTKTKTTRGRMCRAKELKQQNLSHLTINSVKKRKNQREDRKEVEL